MTTEKQKPAAPDSSSEEHPWGQVLADCLWVVTFLMILAFFWQSIGSMLAD